MIPFFYNKYSRPCGAGTVNDRNDDNRLRGVQGFPKSAARGETRQDWISSKPSLTPRRKPPKTRPRTRLSVETRKHARELATCSLAQKNGSRGIDFPCCLFSLFSCRFYLFVVHYSGRYPLSRFSRYGWRLAKLATITGQSFYIFRSLLGLHLLYSNSARDLVGIKYTYIVTGKLSRPRVDFGSPPLGGVRTPVSRKRKGVHSAI